MTYYYILIVDDDLEIREGLAAAVSKEFKNKAVVLNCKNGAVAAELLKCNTIDIVVTDIKMPVMNGIELLQFIADRQLACKSIVLSSYDDFNLVRDAMKLGACDYLLKPVDLNALCRLLHQLTARLTLEHNRRERSASPIDTYKLTESYLKSPLSKTVEMLAFEEKYRLTGRSVCILGCVKLQTNATEKIYKLQEGFITRLYECLNSFHIRYKTILTGEAASCFVFILFPEAEKKRLTPALEHYYEILSSEGHSVKISCHHWTLDAVSKAFTECLSHFELSYYDGSSSLPPDACTPSSSESALKGAAEALSHYDLTAALYYLKRFFAIVNTLKPPVRQTKKELNSMIYSLIKLNPKYIEVLGSSKFTDYDVFHIIETSPGLSVLEKSLFDALNHLVEAVLSTLPDKDDRIIAKAKAYIEDNYSDCITLEHIAAHVYLNKNYFSGFFKSKVGLTYREYLRNYRIRQAKRLLIETDMKIYEIAQAVGYSDSAHFIRAFKSVTGKAPDDYAKSRGT